jgi:hypothetical protein
MHMSIGGRAQYLWPEKLRISNVQAYLLRAAELSAEPDWNQSTTKTGLPGLCTLRDKAVHQALMG